MGSTVEGPSRPPYLGGVTHGDGLGTQHVAQAPTFGEQSWSSAALGTHRARLSPLSRWQQPLLHWALCRHSSPVSCSGEGRCEPHVWLSPPPQNHSGGTRGLGQVLESLPCPSAAGEIPHSPAKPSTPSRLSQFPQLQVRFALRGAAITSGHPHGHRQRCNIAATSAPPAPRSLAAARTGFSPLTKLKMSPRSSDAARAGARSARERRRPICSVLAMVGSLGALLRVAGRFIAGTSAS